MKHETFSTASAFPHDAKDFSIQSGMTKREEFAKAALTGWLAMCASTTSDSIPSPKFVSERCIEMADAMIAALNRIPDPQQ